MNQSDFSIIFSKLIHQVMINSSYFLNAVWFDTKLGAMMAIANNEKLFLLEFMDSKQLERKINSLKKTLNVNLVSGETAITENIQYELEKYFEGKNIIFKTPFHLMGSPFQKKVWENLIKIPYGKTDSYLHLAKSLKKPEACRAVAQANAANRLAIIIPCHRVINSNGKIGGYSSGISRKQWLLHHEKMHFR